MMTEIPLNISRNQLHWFCAILADYPDVQEKIHAELVASLESENEIKKDKCPFTRSVLLEVQRINPVIDTLIHRSSANIVVGGVLIEKGSTMQGLDSLFGRITKAC
jgi:cytochrome P450